VFKRINIVVITGIIMSASIFGGLSALVNKPQEPLVKPAIMGVSNLPSHTPQLSPSATPSNVVKKSSSKNIARAKATSTPIPAVPQTSNTSSNPSAETNSSEATLNSSEGSVNTEDQSSFESPNPTPLSTLEPTIIVSPTPSPTVSNIITITNNCTANVVSNNIGCAANSSNNNSSVGANSSNTATVNNTN
jgi:hypothetical protein